MTEESGFKRPESVLVVIYTRAGQVLLLKRADHENFWQSVTGSMRWKEQDPGVTAAREIKEETGLSAESLRNLGLQHRYEIFPEWRHRYAPDVYENTEHAFALELPREMGVTLNPAEHSTYTWTGFPDAIRQVKSWSNREALIQVADEMKIEAR